MQWLNKVDDALDWVLGPVQTDGDDNGSAGGDNDGDVSAAARASIIIESDDAIGAVAGSADGPTGQDSSADAQLEPAFAHRRRFRGASSHGGAIAEEGRLEIANNNDDTSISLATPRPPPPPPPRKNTATPPPERSNLSATLPPDACPSTPLVAMAEEFSVVDESPYPQNLSSKMNNAVSGEECDDRNHCPLPVDDEAKIREESAVGKSPAEATIREEGEESMSLVASPAKDVTFVGASRRMEMSPLMSQMQDFAEASSPAPTKLIIGDRQDKSSGSHGNQDGDDKEIVKKKMPPPPPPPLWEDATEQQPSSSQAQLQNKTRGPPSPSSFIIQLPAQQSSSSDILQPQQQRHIHGISPLPPPPSISIAPNSAPSNVSPLKTQTNPRAPRSATRIITRGRPTPGVIRRKIRETSLSPPESPESDVEKTSKTTTAIDKTEFIPPPPPWMEGKGEIEIPARRGKTSLPPPPPPQIIPPSGAQNTVITDPPGNTTALDEWEDSPSAAKTGRGKGVKMASIPPPPLGPPHFRDDTPLTDNRKITPKQQSVTEGNAGVEEDAAASLTPMRTVDKALDWILGPAEVAPPDENAPVDDADDDANAGDDANIKDSEENEEPITETITNFFKRMGSTDGGQANNAKKDTGDDGSLAASFHSQNSNESELTDSDELDAFAIPSSTFSRVQEGDDQSWDPSLNQYGFFHVNILRAQRLPCASGSSINATLSLQPWKGRILIPAHNTAAGPEGAGVCLRWDKPPDRKKRRRLGSKDKTTGSKEEEESPEEHRRSHSMVHAYNNEDTPVPTILLELSISSMGGVFDRFLCSVSIPCHHLLQNPLTWARKWHPASIIQGSQMDEEDIDLLESAPLILLETSFEPKVTKANEVATLRNSLMSNQQQTDIDEGPISSEDSDTLGSIPHIIRRNSLEGDESISKSSTLTPALIPRNPITKSHLLRVRSFWTPAWCAVCSKNIITGWMQGKSFECEACHIFCCRDCQLQVDVRVPCGSELATIAVKNAQQYQMGNIMTTLAPYIDGSNPVEKTPEDAKDKYGRRSSLAMLQDEGRPIEGMGIMTIRLLKACLFDKTFPSEAEPDEVFKSDSNLRVGDHYIRVSWLGSKESKRTKTVLQTAKPLFDAEEMLFDVPHYGMEYKLEVVDANTDNPIGSCLLSAQGLLQLQRDDMLASKVRLLLSFFHLRKYSEPRRVKLALRTGVKDGFGLNFYNSSKVSGDPKGKETSRPGEISGWLELDVHLEEDRRLFYTPNPRRCPSPPDEEFDIALIQLHIARIGEIVASMNKIVSSYLYVVSWENPQLTGTALAIFVILTLRFNLEYLGSLPVGCIVIYMIYLAYLRLNGHFKHRWTMKEKEALIKSETEIKKNQSIFRPVGLLQVGDLQGKHLRSRDLGLPGSFYASILYDPLRYADEKMKSSLAKLDTSSGCIHEVGATVSPGITSNPVWTHAQESLELMRLKHLLPDDSLWRQEEEEKVDASLSYPILQPITEDGGFSQEDPDSSMRTGVQLMPWEYSFGALVVQVRFSDVLGSFQMFDSMLGEVVIPLAKLAGSGRAVEGWFRLLDVGTKETLPGESSDDVSVKSGASGDEEDNAIPKLDFPELYLRAKFTANTSRHGGIDQYLPDDMETSKVICEEMSRTASLAQENSIGVIGSSLNTINTVRTLGGKLQNQICMIVDMLERVRNAFNFSNPRFTMFILLGLTLLWIMLALIPTRIVILVAGFAQFGATYYIKFKAPHKKKTIHKEEKAEEDLDSENKGNPLENLFLSIPTDEDLRRTYFWEARRLGEREREKFAISKRQTRLEKLWKANWHGTLQLKEKKPEQSSSTDSSRNWSWENAFALIEGHRFIWWRSEKHFDTGEAPLGQIFFAGHSGLAGLSPLDLRELAKEEIPSVVSIFGRGTQGQQKLTLLASSSGVKDSLENAVLAASMDAKAD